MTAKNDITGHSIVSRATTKSFKDNFDKIFKKQGDCPTDGKVTNKQREILASGDGSISGVPSSCNDYGNTDIEYDGNIK